MPKWTAPAWIVGLTTLCMIGCAGPTARPAVNAGTPAADPASAFAPPPMPEPNEVRTASGEPGPAYWQQRCDYTIAATLDENARTITGRETITYTNNSPDPLGHLWFNLEQNLFRPSSEGSRLTRPSQRFGNRDGFDGGFTIASVEVAGSASPVTLEVNDTIGRLDLPTPVAPRGGRVEVSIAWSFPIPPYGADRMGIDKVRDGDIFQIAQWFPNVCVYDDVHGWNTLPYLGQGEFYTNFGSYDVRLTVPRSHIVAATGELQNPEEVLTAAQRERLSSARATGEPVVIRGKDGVGDPATRPGSPADGPLTWHFKAANVRTFAWASSASFLWDACFVPGSGAGSDGDPTRGSGTLCQSFYPREAAHVWGPDALGGGSTRMLRASLEHYGKKWYAYPYPVASNVNGVVGGMEYPMIVFCGGGRAEPDHTDTIPSARDAERGLFGVTTHEIGHNWFPMTVNTDERRHAWMDEGFNTFMNYYANLERYPDKTPRRGNARVWARDNPEPAEQPVDVPADRLVKGTLGRQQYEKTSVGLVLLREVILGPERFDPAFRAYIRRWAFKSPRPWDFFRTIEDVSGEDLGWFWRGWFYSTGVLDQAVESVVQPKAGASGEDGDARAVFVNRGGLVMPLVYRVNYDDGSHETRRVPVQAWSAAHRWEAAWDTRGRTIKEVVIDPEGELPDVDLKNNRWER